MARAPWFLGNTQSLNWPPTLTSQLSEALTRASTSSSHVEPNRVPAPAKCCLPCPARAVFNRHRCRPTLYLPLLLCLPREPAILENVRVLFLSPSKPPPKTTRTQERTQLNKNFGNISRLNLKTIVSLTAEKPSKPLRAISEEQGIKLVHLGLWHPSTWEEYQPLSKGAVEKSLRLLTTDNLPALLVDGGHGTFVGVLRKLMGWNHTSIILE